MKYYAIIVAGGSGSRMNSDTPKQFHLLEGRPVLMHTIEAFDQSGFNPQVVLVLNQNTHKLWEDLCIRHNFQIAHTIAIGGEQRFHSVQNALAFITDNDAIIAVHDAVRPLVSKELITRTFTLANQQKAVIPVIISKDSVRRKDGDKTIALNREEILLVQTPQVFQSSDLKAAYSQDYSPRFTDDASVAEASGMKIYTTEGDYRNIKITFPEDLLLAELYQKEAKKNPA